LDIKWFNCPAGSNKCIEYEQNDNHDDPYDTSGLCCGDDVGTGEFPGESKLKIIPNTEYESGVLYSSCCDSDLGHICVDENNICRPENYDYCLSRGLDIGYKAKCDIDPNTDIKFWQVEEDPICRSDCHKCDVNSDFIFDAIDITSIETHYAEITDLNYDESYNVDSQGGVDANDVAYCTSRFTHGEVCETCQYAYDNANQGDNVCVDSDTYKCVEYIASENNLNYTVMKKTNGCSDLCYCTYEQSSCNIEAWEATTGEVASRGCNEDLDCSGNQMCDETRCACVDYVPGEEYSVHIFEDECSYKFCISGEESNGGINFTKGSITSSTTFKSFSTENFESDDSIYLSGDSKVLNFSSNTLNHEDCIIFSTNGSVSYDFTMDSSKNHLDKVYFEPTDVHPTTMPFEYSTEDINFCRTCEPTEEIEYSIDGKDNDCDGLVDEPVFKTGVNIWEANCNYYMCTYSDKVGEYKTTGEFTSDLIYSVREYDWDSGDSYTKTSNKIVFDSVINNKDLDCLIYKSDSVVRYNIKFQDEYNEEKIYLSNKQIHPVLENNGDFYYSSSECALSCSDPASCGEVTMGVKHGCSYDMCIFDCGGYWTDVDSMFDWYDYCSACEEDMQCSDYTNRYSCGYDPCGGANTKFGCSWNTETSSCVDPFEYCVPGTTLCDDGECREDCELRGYEKSTCVLSNVDYTSIKDISLNSNDGQIENAKLNNDGVFNEGFEFDGNSYITVSDDSTLDFEEEDFSISMWVNSDNFDKVYQYISKREICANDNFFDIRGTTDEKVIFEINGGTESLIVKTDKLEKDEWNFITFVRDSDKIYAYLDGELSNSEDIDGDYDVSNNADVGISTGPCVNVDDTERYGGLIDDLRIYNRALSSDEVDSLYKSSPISHGLVLYFTFDSDNFDTYYIAPTGPPNGVCEIGEGCACEDCYDKRDSCTEGSICSGDELCGCPEETTLCVDGTCSFDCESNEGKQGCVGEPNNVCEFYEGCACDDCINKRDSCISELECNLALRICLEPESANCAKGETLCVDGTCNSDCTNNGGAQGCIGLKNDICESGEGCACEDCYGKRDSCAKGLVCNSNDELCDDKPEGGSGIEQCIDLDKDGYYKISDDCIGSSDCLDRDPDVNPGMIEICHNQIDDDCDYEIDEDCPEKSVNTYVEIKNKITLFDSFDLVSSVKNNMDEYLDQVIIDVSLPRGFVIDDESLVLTNLAPGETKYSRIKVFVKDYELDEVKMNYQISTTDKVILSEEIPLKIEIPTLAIKADPEDLDRKSECVNLYAIVDKNVEYDLDLELNIVDSNAVFKTLLVDYMPIDSNNLVTPMVSNPYCLNDYSNYNIESYLYKATPGTFVDLIDTDVGDFKLDKKAVEVTVTINEVN